MFDLLYVHPLHASAAQITYYYRLCNIEESPWPIDTVSSGGMNGFLWLTKRNACRQVIPSPVSGLRDITDSQVLNITYLNPSQHAHIPKPPEGVILPAKVLTSIDIKPFPVLWHEDNRGRNQLGKERPQVSGAIYGPTLGEASYRLVQNTLNIKSEQMSYRNSQVNQAINRPRPAGPPGYERGISEGFTQNSSNNHHAIYRPRAAGQYGYELGYYNNPNFHDGHYFPRSPAVGSKYYASPNNKQDHRPNIGFKMQDRNSYMEQQQNLRNDISALCIERGSKIRPLEAASPGVPNSSQITHVLPQLVPNIGPLPSPPPKWISRPAAGNTVMYTRQEVSSTEYQERPVKKMVYQPKYHSTPNLMDSEPQQ